MLLFSAAFAVALLAAWRHRRLPTPGGFGKAGRKQPLHPDDHPLACLDARRI